MANPIIVTGASGALGHAVVCRLVEQGERVVGIDRGEPRGMSGAALELGGVDLTEPSSVTSAMARIVAQEGPPRGLVTIAGGFAFEPVAEGSAETFDKMYQMNVRTAVSMVYAALPHLTQTKGSIVTIGAAAALQPGAGMAPYAASKAAIHALTQSLADEMSGKGVRVNAVLPTILDTPTNRQSMPDADPAQWVSLDDAASAIVYLLSEAASGVNGALVRLG